MKNASLWMSLLGLSLTLGVASCTGFRYECADGIDNDEDGLVDDEDPGCSNDGGTGLDDEQRRKLQEELCAPGSATVGLPVQNPACNRLNVGSRESDDPQCYDRVDNDEDGFYDMHDLGCSSIFDDDETNPACVNGEDDDEDGLVDYLADPGCRGDPNGQSESFEPACVDRLDNDGDGLTDFPYDFGCTGFMDDSELGNECSDGIDNDGDGLIDYGADPATNDPDCTSFSGMREAAAQCNNGIDDDLDGYIDFDGDAEAGIDPDLGCQSRIDDDESDNPACSNFRDDDGDGLIDWAGFDANRDGTIDIPADPSCADPLDESEYEVECSNLIDDDDNGLIDFPEDPGCSSENDFWEAMPQCMNGLDDDLDGWTDYPSDPGCTDLRDDYEDFYRCSDGQDNDGDGHVDWPDDPGCSSALDSTESDITGGVNECIDLIDNDGDGFIDSSNDHNVGDPACDAGKTREELDPVCGDRVDNDGDGRADYDGIDLNDDGIFDLPGEYPPDPGCFEATHYTESVKPECADGEDNDGDGQQDYNGLDLNGDGLFTGEGEMPPDDGCDGGDDPGPGSRPYRDIREGRPSQCDDGIDNDGDGLTDYEPELLTNGSPNPAYLLGDSECPSLFHNNEAVAP